MILAVELMALAAARFSNARREVQKPVIASAMPVAKKLSSNHEVSAKLGYFPEKLPFSACLFDSRPFNSEYNLCIGIRFGGKKCTCRLRLSTALSSAVSTQRIGVGQISRWTLVPVFSG